MCAAQIHHPNGSLEHEEIAGSLCWPFGCFKCLVVIMRRGTMRIVQGLIILAVSVLGLTSCARGPQFIPHDPTQRLASDVVSILPPQGEGWLMVSEAFRKQQGLNLIFEFFKPTPPSRTRTILAVVQRRQVPKAAGSREELLQKLVQVYWELTNRERPMSLDTSPDKTLGSDCIRYDTTHFDLGVPGYPGSIFVWEAHGFICLHPDLPDIAIDIQYSQRRLQEESSLSLEAEGEPFLKSLLFTR